MSSGHSERSWWMTYTGCVIKDSIFDLEKRVGGKKIIESGWNQTDKLGSRPIHSLRHVRPSSYPDIVYPLIYKIQQTTIPERKKTKKSCIGIKNKKLKLMENSFSIWSTSISFSFIPPESYSNSIGLYTHTFEKRNLCIFSADTHLFGWTICIHTHTHKPSSLLIWV
jgi:hypothetical protein